MRDARASLLLWTALLHGLALSQASYDQSYDFIIIGGGIGGLVAANRLSEISNVTVLVIEAGDYALDSNNSTFTDLGGNLIMTSLDWGYESALQIYTGRGEYAYLPAGKGVGGSSLINGMVYTRAEAAQIDTWEAVGNPGWNWDSLFSYYKRSENLQLPFQRQIDGGATYNLDFHGERNPLWTGWSQIQQISDYRLAAATAFDNLGIPTSADIAGGYMRGFNIFPKTMTTQGDVRADAGRAYFYPYQNRTNLFMMANTQGLRINWGPDEEFGNATASGVEVLGPDGTTYHVRANLEVILSCGSYRSPQLLELSGIGNAKLLSQHDISVKVDLPGVGENLMDQAQDRIIFSAPENQTNEGVPSAITYFNITDLLGDEASAFGTQIWNDLPDYAAQIAAQNNNATSQGDLLTLLQMQHKLIFTDGITMMEFLQVPSHGSNGVTGTKTPTFACEMWSLLPFARGNVHITTADPAVTPSISANYFMFYYDTFTQISGARFIRKLFGTTPLRFLITGEILPGLDIVAEDADDDTWGKWLKDNFRTAYHPVGTAMMMPRSMGGVVSDRTKVYGTSNVRVVDASIFTFQTNGHTSSTVYAIAEKAADLIKQDHGYPTTGGA